MAARRWVKLLIPLPLLALLAVPAAPVAPAQAAAVTARYVALGDSFTAGPLIPIQHGTPLGCLRSTKNYAAVAARQLSVGTFVDVSCSGADTGDMTAAQDVTPGTNPPQFTALTADTTLVTLGIGGNDIGYTDIFQTCAELSFRNPFGAPCMAEFGDELDQRIADTAPKVAAVLEGIRERAPQARILVVGYLRLLPASRGCWPVVPVARGDVPWLDGIEQSLNGMLEDQAERHGAGFVDAYAGGSGHDMCASPGEKWVEGLVPTSLAAPIHPNAAGMAVVAGRVVAAIEAAATAAR
jgi:lysophospholipase L1-like esterase